MHTLTDLVGNGLVDHLLYSSLLFLAPVVISEAHARQRNLFNHFPVREKVRHENYRRGAEAEPEVREAEEEAFVGAVFVGAAFVGAAFVGGFVGADFVGADFVGAAFVGTTVGAAFVGAFVGAFMFVEALDRLPWSGPRALDPPAVVEVCPPGDSQNRLLEPPF